LIKVVPVDLPRWKRPVGQGDWTPAKTDATLTAQDIMLVRTSFSLVVPIQDAVASLFYDRLFAVAPELRRLFRMT
jgi:hypothetical protein